MTSSERPLRILTFSTLYPNAAQLNHGIFVENRLRHLLQTGSVQAHVIAPVPWFPFRGQMFGHYATFAAAPAQESRHGIVVEHPRYPVIPRCGMTLSPLLMYAAVRGAVRRYCRGGDGIDLIDAHYFYPDGVAAALLARELELPLTITARGTDINLIPRYPAARRMILWAAGRADGLITVCQALKDELVALGVSAEKVRALRNGIDLQTFRPMPRADARARLGVDGPVLLSVGGLIPRKRHDLVIDALALLDNGTLLIAGEGPERGALEQRARDKGVGQRVRFLGSVAHARLPEIYSAGDVLILASSREGWANVLLEAMACGTPVIATNVWGAPEVITSPAAGMLLHEPAPAALAQQVRMLLANPPCPEETRRYAEGFSWDATSEGQLALFRDILASRRQPAAKLTASAGAIPSL